MASIYSHIDQNKRDTFLVMLLFVVVVTAIGYVIGMFIAPSEPEAGYFLASVALIFSGISGFSSYYFSDKLVLAISGAKKVEESDNPYLHKLVENMCIASGLPKPEIYMINDSAMNAFATGRDPQHSVLCFTSGIVERLEKRELEGVVAHELSHIQNYDIRLMSIVSVLVGSITLLADWFTRGVFYRSRSSRRGSSEINGPLFLVGLALVILSPIIATIIKLALSRKREFLADASGALLTRYPQGLANALRKISSDGEILEAANGATAHLYIENPLKNHNSLSNLFNTHPPVEERIKRLESM